MRTARLETVHALVSVASPAVAPGRCPDEQVSVNRSPVITARYHWGVGQMNKFEHVSSDHHQMLLAAGPRSDLSTVDRMIDGQTRPKSLPFRKFVGER